jgi:hypothetical protein
MNEYETLVELSQGKAAIMQENLIPLSIRTPQIQREEC